MSHLKERYAEILDGKKVWGKNRDAAGDADVFLAAFVNPLRRLRAQGMFDRLAEHEGNSNGKREIDRVDIIGAIDFDCPSPDEDDELELEA